MKANTLSTEEFEKHFLELGLQLGCDKVLNHSYETAYARHLSPLHQEPISLLEIGVGGEGYADGGQSLALWEALFPQAMIYGLDIYDKSQHNRDRVKTFIIDQSDATALYAFAQQYGPFDVIIDDGSHHRADVLTSLFALMPHVKEGGYYVIEDCSASYWPAYEGSTLAHEFLDTPIIWLKKAIEVVHREDLLFPQDNLPNWNLRSVSVYSGLGFLEVGHTRIGKNIPDSSGFYENQRELDELRYGQFKHFFTKFSLDAMASVQKILKSDHD
ncbi:MAG: hypothetical protein KGZ80_03240 [Methylomonas sp.]|nr:hypothetical protein [Methylomonas sp.]PPD22441.1 MAG: hypothetical protein CTY23_02500 [Methylomonas sp.]PPD42065.1 MAG: hypothetical protein CTY17_02035 [Methylomonas sp.]PPD53753.1 MAG: hypothetical protein CTY11_05270 [Methylomonas sp.]